MGKRINQKQIKREKNLEYVRELEKKKKAALKKRKW